MKQILRFSLLMGICVAWLMPASVNAQCTTTLATQYCQAGGLDTVTSTCGGNPATMAGPGVVNDSVFNPALAGPGIHDIELIGDYVIDQTGLFDPLPGSGTSVTLGDDQLSTALPIGFSFNFFGSAYTNFYISSNGFISFDATAPNGCCSGQVIPNTGTPNNLISFAWEDLDPAGVGTIEYFTTGTSPNQILVMNFIGIPHFPGPSTAFAVTSQVQLHEGCGRIEIHTTTQPGDGGNGSHTMGIENSGGTKAFAVSGRNSTAWTATNDFVAFDISCPDTVQVEVIAAPSLLVADSIVSCFGEVDGALYAQGVTTAGPLAYLWSSGGTDSIESGLGAGAYSVTVTDAVGCTKSWTNALVTTPTIVDGNPMAMDNNCEGDSEGWISAGAFGGTPGYTYLWDDGGAQTTDTATNLAEGTYNLTITDSKGCTAISSATVGFVNSLPPLNLGADTAICDGDEFQLVAPGGFLVYNWDDGSTTQFILVNSAGTYSVTATAFGGCSNSDDITVTLVTPGPAVNLGADIARHPNDLPVTLDAGSHSTYLWNDLNATTTQTLDVTFGGNYSVTVTDENGCLSTDDVNVLVYPNGIEEGKATSFNVFPNPTFGQFSIQNTGNLKDLEIEIVDIQGKVMYQNATSLNTQSKLDVSLEGMAKGIYLVKLTFDGTLEQHRIVVQ